MKFSTILAAITASFVQAQSVTVRRTDGTSNGLYAPVGQCQGLGGSPINLVQFPQGGGLGVKFYRDFGCKGGEITMIFREQSLSPPISPNSYRIYYERGPTQESFYNAPQYYNVPQHYNPPMYFNPPQYYNNYY
jgi:hypothetical protein